MNVARKLRGKVQKAESDHAAIKRENARLRRVLLMATRLENTEHADCCEGCETCDVFNAIDKALGIGETK